jgi:hypothetical protein
MQRRKVIIKHLRGEIKTKPEKSFFSLTRKLKRLDVLKENFS